MSLSARLAERALSAADAEPSDRLRALSLANVLAGAGRKGAAGRLIASLPLCESRSAQDAAFLLGATLHARTQDDFFPAGRSHVGAVTLAAALALADETEERFLPAVAAGYEVMCAGSEAYAPIAQAAGLRPSGVFGPLGAAATAAIALGLDADRVQTAIGLAAAASAGTNQAWLSGTDEWLFVVGAAARAGVEAALFARAGAAASPLALEGPAGWAKALLRDEGAARLEAVVSDPRSRISEVALKLYPVSGIAQVPTALACEVREELRGASPDRVMLRVSEAELAYPGSANVGPFPSRSSALMSLRFCVACGLADGVVSVERLDEPNAPAVASLADRIELVTGVEENHAELVVTAGGLRLERAGDVARLLYTSWDELRAQLGAVARRSEAPDALAVAAYEALAAPRPDARVVRRLFGRVS